MVVVGPAAAAPSTSVGAARSARGGNLSYKIKLGVSAIAVGHDLRVSGTIAAPGWTARRESDLRLILQQRTHSRWVTVKAVRLGAVNYLTKPADVDEILVAFNPEAKAVTSPWIW